MKNLDESQEEKLDKSDDNNIKLKIKEEDEKESSDEDLPKKITKKKKNKKVEKVEMQNINNKELGEPLKSDDESEEDYK